MEGDIQKATALLKEVSAKCEDTTTHIDHLVNKAKNGDFDTSKGISFLEVKYQLLLSYLTNLTYVMLKKSSGKAILGDEAVDRLVEIRTVLEKIRPIDQKLKYQVDKVVRIAVSGGADSNDPMRLKANPDSLESKIKDEDSDSDDDDDDSDDDEDKSGKSSKAYVPPKLAAVHYDGDDTVESKKQKQIANIRKRALSSDILQDLKDQYYDGPTEIKETQDLHRFREDKKRAERTRYEEENFIRLMLTKKEKQAQKRLATVSSLNNLTHFGNISALDMDADQLEASTAKKRKLGGKGKGKSKKGKKGFKKKRKK
ncbi:hypothetical protein ACF0H5_006374 [Mactra antiquata]